MGRVKPRTFSEGRRQWEGLIALIRLVPSFCPMGKGMGNGSTPVNTSSRLLGRPFYELLLRHVRLSMNHCPPLIESSLIFEWYVHWAGRLGLRVSSQSCFLCSLILKLVLFQRHWRLVCSVKIQFRIRVFFGSAWLPGFWFLCAGGCAHLFAVGPAYC